MTQQVPDSRPTAPAVMTRRAAIFRIGIWGAFIPLVVGPTSPIPANAQSDLPTNRCPEQECSWLYNPAIGDPEGGIPPGIAFEDLPDDWECPECGTPKYLW